MGYESRIYVAELVRPYEGLAMNSKGWASKIAVFDLCKLGLDGNIIYDVFDKEIDFDLYDYNGDEPIERDMYDEPLRWCRAEDLKPALDKWISRHEPYRRTEIFKAFLDSALKQNWDDLICIHYGY